MESFLKLYFGNSLGKSRVIMTLLYLFAVILIVRAVLGWFGIHYSFPKEITVSSVFAFILSGQILYPIAGIILYYGINEFIVRVIAQYLYNRYKFILFRTIADDKMVDDITHELFMKKYISYTYLPGFKKSPLMKGVTYHEFEPFMKGMFWEDFNVVSSWKLSTDAVFAIMLALLFNLNGQPIITVAFILSLIGWLLFLVMYWAQARQSEYRSIYEQIYFNVANPTEATELQPVSTWNKHLKKYQNWERMHYLKKRAKKWKEIRERKVLSAL